VRVLRGPRSGEAGSPEGAAAVANVAVDTLGADGGVAEVSAGALAAARDGASCVLFGPLAELRQALGDPAPQGIELVDAPQAIANDEEPAHAVRAKGDASIVQAAEAVGSGRADALVSAGSTGAALAASLLRIKRLSGVYRPAVAVQVPVPGRRLLLLDVGANVEVRPEQLVQFAFMGAAFCEGVLGIERPEVGLLTVGSEQGKGTPEVVSTYEQLAAGPLNFIGNVEGNDLTAGRADVVVTDGFTGNVALKAIEGTASTVTGAIRERIAGGTISKLGGLLIRSRLRGLRDEISPETVGGAYLLGLRNPVVICHGGSSARAITNAIALASRGVDERVVERTATSLERAGVLRGSQEGAPASVAAGSVKRH
jgi:glycerol-3-phosphate acyltransferase PlsX